MPAKEREMRTRTLRRGHIYGVQGVETLAVVESTIRGVKVRYTGEFDTEPQPGIESGQTKQTK